MTPDENLTADEQAQFDAMRTSDQPDASPVEPAAPETPAQPASATPEASPDTTAEPAQPEEPKRTQMVPHSALHEERERRKDTEKQLQEERRRFNLAWEKLNAPAQPQQPATTPEIPDFATDPAGNILGTMRQTGMTVEQLAQAVKDLKDQQEQRATVENLVQVGNLAEQRVRVELPDYDAAVNFLAQKRMEEAQIMGVPNPAAWFNRLKLDWVRMHGEEAPRKAYELAKTLGYAPAAPPSETAQATPAADLERVQAGQQQARSLGGARGSSPSGIPPAERISKMTPSEFDAFMTKAEKEGNLRDFMGV